MTSPQPRQPRLPDVSTLFPWHAWVRDRALRSTTTWLFVALASVPTLTFVLFRSSPGWSSEATVFALYFAAAWFVVLWLVVRPQHVQGRMLAAVAGVALVVEVPLAIALERALDAGTGDVLTSIVTVGIPEELAKMVPVAALVAWRHRLARPLPPRDVLFLGAVSGLAFGAVEAIHYVTEYLPQMLGASMGVGGALQVVWRLLCDPVAHACWAGVAGYFLGLASYYRTAGPCAALAGIGLGVPAILHGVNDVVAGGVLWVVVTVVSALLFLAYARVGIAPRPVADAAPDPVTAPLALGRHHAAVPGRR